MMKEFIIGRNGNQPFKITSDGVSGEHAKLIISDGVWTIEDLETPNGTYIKDESGIFQRIFKKSISEDSIIRLGKGGHHSYTFMAHRVLAEENDYSYEFVSLKKILFHQVEQESNQEKINVRNGWIAKCAGVGAVILCSIIGLFTKVDVNTRYILIAFAPIVVGLLFRNDTGKLKEIKNRRRNIIVCPKCGRPLSEFDVENMQCSTCKAK